MYSNDDLNLAIEKEIFTQASVDAFKKSISEIKNTPSIDEENFKLIGGFNDVFVVIACGLLLFSSVFVLRPISETLGSITFIILSWVLSEFFVLKRKMALPAIVLLMAFIGGVFSLCTSLSPETSGTSLIITAAMSSIAAYLHWLRFKVPITVAVGTVALIGLLISIILNISPQAKEWILMIVALCGVGSFLLAMYWDSADTNRITRKSDVAFWLHLVSAPLIIHPIFSSLGVLEGNQSIVNMMGVILLYILMTTVSLSIDRRAFMVSSLIYVLYALSTIINTYGDASYGFALTGVLMGSALLLLSAFWHVTRNRILKVLPLTVRKYLPE